MMKNYTVYLFYKGSSIMTCDIASGETIHVGKKGHGANIQIDHPTVSRKHLEIINTSAGLKIKDPGSLNGTFLNGELIQKNIELVISESDIISIGENYAYTLKFKNKSTPEITPPHKNDFARKTLAQQLTNKSKLIIGRSNDKCDIVLVDNTVSRIHAAVYREDSSYFIEDLQSTNGTFVNGKRISTKTNITHQDKIFIGLSLFQLDKVFKDLSQEAAIQAVEIEKNYNKSNQGKKFVGLRKISITVPKNEFVALMGPSGCGKSTLLKALNGDTPADLGKVFIHGLELSENYEFIKRKIGYVPQDDIVHKDLSVYDSLYYAAKLRMGDLVSNDIIENKITEALKSLNIDCPEIRKKKVGELSGGQRKRVSIAVELLNSPSILFLDEPTSPLDPETIEEFLKCIRKLTEQGTTVIMVTHKPEDLNYVDKVIFLGTDGYQAYYGDKGNPFLQHFNKQDIIGIYALLSRSKTSLEWYQKWRNSFQIQHVSQGKPPAKESQESLFRQFYWLSVRYAKLKMNDSMNMVLLLAQPIIIAGLLCLVFSKFNQGVLFLMAITAVWFGVSNAAKEIVSELPIYRRERMFNLCIHTYLLSKISILTLISLFQIVIFAGIVYVRYSGQEQYVDDLYQYCYTGMGAYFPNVLFLTWISFSATLLGLLLSAWFSNAEKVMTVVPIALIPQIMLAGIIAPFSSTTIQFLSYFSLGRWGMEGLARLHDIFGNGFVVENLSAYTGEIENVKVGALDILQLYRSDLLQWFNTDGMQGVFWVTIALNLVIYAGIYIFLRRKDSLN